MASGQLNLVLRHLHALVNAERAGELTDAELVRQFTNQRDETAFAALVHRHGPLVLSVCRRLLHDYHEAEDAFQATFLVLARKAAGIHQPELVVSWLHKVAYRIAIKVLAESARRRDQERQACPMRPPKPDTEVTLQELRLVLDEELQRLPEKYQAPLMLCYLEGKSHAEAARHLGWPLGTIKGRLARGRELLRARLTRRGMALSVGSLTAVLAENTAPAATLPAGLMASTVRAAIMFSVGKATTAGEISAKVAALAEGTIRAMVATKVKASVMFVVAVGFLAVGGGLGAYHALGAKPQAAEAVGAEKPVVVEDGPGVDKKQARTDLYGDPLPPGAIARLGTNRLRHPNLRVAGIPVKGTFSADGQVLTTSGLSALRMWDTATGKLLRKIPEDQEIAEDQWLFCSTAGRFLATHSGQSINLRDPKTGQIVKSIRTGSQPLAFSHDDKLLVDSSLDLWEIATGKHLVSLSGHAGRVYSAAFTLDGKTLVTVDWPTGALASAKICRWDVATGTLRKSLDALVPQGRTMRLSPDGQTLAVAPSSREPVSLWDTETGRERVKLQGEFAHACPPVSCGQSNGLAFAPDGKTLATDYWAEERAADGTVSLWDAGTGQLIRRFQASTGATSNLQFAPDGRTLLGSGFGPRFHLWDTLTGQELGVTQSHVDEIHSLALTPDGKRLVSYADDTVRLWEISTGRPLRVVARDPLGLYCMALTPDGRAVLSGGYSRLRLIELETGKELRSFLLDEHAEKLPKLGWRSGHSAYRLGVSADGRRAASLSSAVRQTQPNMVDFVHVVHVWDMATARAITQREMGFAPGVQFLGFSPGVQDLAAVVSPPQGGWTEAQIAIQDALTGRQLRIVPQPDEFKHMDAFSPDGRTFVTTTSWVKNTDKGIEFGPAVLHFWELATGKERLIIRFPEGHGEYQYVQIAFGPDSRTLATARRDGILQLWDVATGKELFRRAGPVWPAGEDSSVTAMALSPDGKLLVTGHHDSTILVWDLSIAMQPDALGGGQREKKDLEGWWSDLAGPDAAKAYRAIWSLAAAPTQSVPMLRDYLHPAEPASAEKVKRLIKELDSKEFQVREAASRRLAELGEQTEPLLEAVLKAKPTLEQRRRIEQLLSAIPMLQPPEQLRGSRAIEVLEHVGTPDAQDVLTTLGKGAPEARVTREAKASLERLAKRAAARP
jgi:RNA polymerase sigma factor (sigma-70 family)